ncbi:MAG: hypothetical protein Tsb009_26360 [Planctomycetaceae bacterium]
MATEWYYAQNGQQHGPVTPKDLRNLAVSGTLQPGDLVWKEGMADWVPASQIKGLLPTQTAPATRPGLGPVQIQTRSTGQPRTRKSARNPIGQVVLIIASLTMIGAMFTPWWSMKLVESGTKEENERAKGRWAKFVSTLMLAPESRLEKAIDQSNKALKNPPKRVTDEDKKSLRQIVSLMKIAKKDRKWWDAHLKGGKDTFEDHFEEVAEKTDEDEKLSMKLTIWGWNETIAIMSMVFGAVILVGVILFLSVPPMRRWNWIISLIATVMAVISLIFVVIWIVKAPGDDVGSDFVQGIIVGPYILAGGAGLMFLVGLLDTIFGLAYLARSRRLQNG